MAELILTDEERNASSYLDWDDASIGRAVKKISLKIDDVNGENSISWCAAVMTLLAREIDANTEGRTMTIKGLSDDGRSLGDWEVSVRKL